MSNKIYLKLADFADGNGGIEEPVAELICTAENLLAAVKIELLIHKINPDKMLTIYINDKQFDPFYITEYIKKDTQESFLLEKATRVINNKLNQ